MATIKSFPDFSQSKKLAEFLPIESADMCFVNDGTAIKIDANSYNVRKHMWKGEGVQLTPCWSLAALLSVLPNGIVMNKDSQNGRYHFSSTHAGTYVTTDNPIDACYEMILKLYELNLL